MSAWPHTSSRVATICRARLDVRLVGNRRADARALLDEHGVARVRRSIATPDGSHADAKFLSLDLFGYADPHVVGAASSRARPKINVATSHDDSGSDAPR